MRIALVLATGLCLAVCPSPAAEPPVAQPGGTISWEAAAKELREVTYKDAAVVTRSREFVNVFLTAGGASEDFGELRARYAIEGLIVSPRHIFAFPDGHLEVFVKLEEDKDLGAQIDVVRAVGRPGLRGATACLVAGLDAKDEALRGNVAVSLEYIGDPEAVDGLKGRLDREKSEAALATRSVSHRARGPHGSPPPRRSVASMVGRVRARSSRWRACTAAAILTLERCIVAPRGRLAVASERRGPSGSTHA